MNWHEIIDEAEMRGSFTREEKIRAGDWVTCACGQTDPRIKRREKGGPLDGTLRWLGKDFARCVRYNDVTTSRRILRQIDEREAELLAEVSE